MQSRKQLRLVKTRPEIEEEDEPTNGTSASDISDRSNVSDRSDVSDRTDRSEEPEEEFSDFSEEPEDAGDVSEEESVSKTRSRVRFADEVPAHRQARRQPVRAKFGESKPPVKLAAKQSTKPAAKQSTRPAAKPNQESSRRPRTLRPSSKSLSTRELIQGSGESNRDFQVRRDLTQRILESGMRVDAVQMGHLMTNFLLYDTSYSPEIDNAIDDVYQQLAQ